ncbi:MAG: hypothetical protein H7A36_03115 [Chlamydiales bacterium]|nr:hypothetical protein [Chlamydiales bacterium]
MRVTFCIDCGHFSTGSAPRDAELKLGLKKAILASPLLNGRFHGVADINWSEMSNSFTVNAINDFAHKCDDVVHRSLQPSTSPRLSRKGGDSSGGGAQKAS